MKGLTERQKADLVNQRMQANNLSRQKGSQAGPAARGQQRSSSHPSNGAVSETSLHSRAAKESGALSKGMEQMPVWRSRISSTAHLVMGIFSLLWLASRTGVSQPLPAAARLGSTDGQAPRLKRGREADLDEDYVSDFVESGGDGGEDWRRQLRNLTGYDPSKCVPLLCMRAATFAISSSSGIHARQ